MMRKTRSPAAPGRAHRAAGSEFLGRLSNPQNIQDDHPGQGISSAALLNTRGSRVEAHIFVSRLGRIGYWIACCPMCGYEHVHGGYAPFDPRQRQGFAKFQVNLKGPQSLGWRAPHCHQAPRSDTHEGDGHEYELMLAAGPARIAPGAENSRRAKRTMDYLRSIGVRVSNDILPSANKLSWWRWR
jgi:hypothetical protein